MNVQMRHHASAARAEAGQLARVTDLQLMAAQIIPVKHARIVRRYEGALGKIKLDGRAA